MKEVLNSQNEERNPRPIGRFLLGMEDYSGQHDPVEYAMKFAKADGNFHKHRHKSAKVNGEEVMVDGRKVELAFEISRYAYIWKIIVFAEKHLTEHLSTGYQPHGGETYELHCAIPKSSGNYAEYGNQRNIIRRREFDDSKQLNILQGIVEQIVQIQDS